MTDRVLINRINRGGFSFAFALMVLDALGQPTLDVPKLSSTLPRVKAPIATRSS